MKIGLVLALALALPLHADVTGEELSRRADAFIRPLVDQSVFSGVILLAKGDQILLHRAYGNANYEFAIANTTETRFPIASISKHFTGIILRRLEQEKKLALSDPLAKYVPSFPRAGEITLDHLRTHRSGVRDPEDLRLRIRMSYAPAEVVALLAAKPLASEPGGEYSYTTANYSILAHVIEKVTGETYEQVATRMIYAPAGMKDSGELVRPSIVPKLAAGYMPDPYGEGLAVCGPEDTSWKAAGGAAYSTVRDLHRYVRAFYAGRLIEGVPLRPFFNLGKVFDREVYRSSGGFPGASANLAYFLDDEVTIAVTSNNYAPLASAVADALAAMYFEQPYSPLQRPAASKEPVDPSPVYGRYKMGTFPAFEIASRGGRLLLSWTTFRVSSLEPLGGDRWFEKLDWMILQAERDATGNVTGFTATAPWSSEPMKAVRVAD